MVGYALHALPAGTNVPWHRVVNAQGAISVGGDGAARQRQLLEREGVRFDHRGRMDLGSFQWRPELPSRSIRARNTGTPKNH